MIYSYFTRLALVLLVVYSIYMFYSINTLQNKLQTHCSNYVYERIRI